MPPPLKILIGGIFFPTNGRQVRTPPTTSHIPAKTNIFDKENDLDKQRLLESLTRDGKTFIIPSLSPTMGGMVHPTKQPPKSISSTQIDPNEIQLKDVLKDERMDV